jgi:uncharacterized membrane protein YphA (DoxX/SURF4 family)
MFIYSGIIKIISPDAFIQAISNYQLLPPSLIKLLVFMLPWWEVGAGVALLFPAWRLSGLWLVIGMSLVFLFATSSAWIRGLDIECGCFGLNSHKPFMAMLLDLGILIISLYLKDKTVRAADDKCDIINKVG